MKSRTLFLDESGKAAFSHPSKFFILSACSILSENITEIRNIADHIIFKYWGSSRSYTRKYGIDHLVFHAKDIKETNGPFIILKDPKINKLFWKDLSSQILQRPDITYYLSVFDKLTVKKRIPTWKETTTFRKIYDFTLESFLKQLIKEKSSGQIIAESSSDQDIALVTILNNLRRNSLVKFRSGSLVNEKITSLSLVNKHDSDIGPQIADLMAWVGANKFMVDNKMKKIQNLRNEERTLLEIFNKRLASKAQMFKYNKFKIIS